MASAEVRNVILQKKYRDRNGQWKATNSYGINDIPKLIMAATKAYDFLTSKEGETGS